MSNSVGKLYGPRYVPKVMKNMVIAEINGLEIETTAEFDIMKDTKDPEYLKKFPLGQSPAFESKSGMYLSESAAISMYLAELKKDTTLFGSTPDERAKVYQYIFNNETQVDRFASSILYPILGFMKYDEETEKTNYTYLDRNLEFYNNELATKEYLVGNQLTLADIFLFFSLYYPYQKFISDERKTKFANITKYLERLAKLDSFAKALKHAQ